MASRHQVRCIRKRGGHYNSHERIQGIGGTNSDGTPWFMAEDDAIRDIENGTYSFYVIANQREVNLIVAIHERRKYLRTTADGYEPNNLLALPECP